MVYVRLEQQWTDSTGTEYAPGAMVNVDAATLAGLEARGVVAEAGPSPQPGGGGGTEGVPQPDDDPDGVPQPDRRGGGRGDTDGVPQPD